MRATLLLVSMIFAACAPDDPRPVAQRSTSAVGDEPVVVGCIDADGDGFGENCTRGRDCDEQDPAVTNECYRCSVPTEGCDCPDEQAPVACDVDTNAPVTDDTCWVGQRTCVNGNWSRCAPYSPRFN